MWALQEFSARNCELVSWLRGISCASGERLAALAFRFRGTLAPSALVFALSARFSTRLRRSFSGSLPRIESLTKTIVACKIGSFLGILDNLLQKNVIVFFLKIKFQNGAHLKHGLFLIYFSHFSYQGKVTKVPSAHISLTYIHVFCSSH